MEGGDYTSRSHESTRFRGPKRDRHRRRARHRRRDRQAPRGLGRKVTIWDLDGSRASMFRIRSRLKKHLRPSASRRAVNNAGIAGMNKPTVDYPIEEWERVLRVNLTSQFLCCRAVAPLMVRAATGASSTSLHRRQGRQSERGRVFRLQGGRDCVDQEPGQGARADRGAGELRHPGGCEDGDLRPDDQQHIDYMLSKIPMNRFVTVDEIARWCAGWRARTAPSRPAAVFDISGGRATY